MHIAPPTVLITGATDGIGRALAEHYAARGARLALVGRRPLAHLDGPLFTDASYCQADLRQPDCAAQIERWLAARGVLRLDVLLHNAGLGWYGRVDQQPNASIDDLLRVNLYAPIAITHALLPYVWRARGTLVFVSSVGAGLPVADYAVYGATKAALEAFARNLRIELRDQVRVQVVRPGPTRTAMHAKSGAPASERVLRRFPSATQVASQIIAAVDDHTPRTTIGVTNRMLSFAGTHLPALIDRAAQLRTRRLAPGHSAPALERPHCLITGAADGIGRALAQRFALAGYTITGVDVDVERAEQTRAALAVQGAPATFLRADLASATDIERLMAQLSDGPPIAVCIHCAGINAVGRFAGVELARQTTVLDVNLRAPLLLTAGLLRRRALAPRGTLVLIASLSVFVSYPGAAVYAASKDGMSAYARSLRVALAPDGGHVLAVYPGPTRTAHARRYSPDNRREQRRMPPEQLAALIFDAVQRRQRVLIPGAGNRLSAWIGRAAPRLTEWVMRKTILEKLD